MARTRPAREIQAGRSLVWSPIGPPLALTQDSFSIDLIPIFTYYHLLKPALVAHRMQ